jgi:hypothetical protein
VTSVGTVSTKAGSTVINNSAATMSLEQIETGGRFRNDGLVTMTGTNPFLVTPTGRLSGAGKVDGNVVIQGGIKPGNSPGILTIAGSFDMKTGSVFDEEIDRGIGGPIACNGAGCYGRLDVSGGTMLEDSTLKVTLDAATVVGDLYGIIDNMDALPVTGIFAGLGEDATFTSDFGGEAYLFEVSYDGNIISPSLVTFDGGNDVVLQVINAVAVPAPLIGRGLPVVLAVGGVLFGAKLLAVERREDRGSSRRAVPHRAPSRRRPDPGNC